MLKALIFDVDGTLADTEMAHLAAFNHAFREMGLDWHWDVPLYTKLLSVSGGKERIKAFWQSQEPRRLEVSGTGYEETVLKLHEIKTAAYEQAVQDGAVAMRDGVLSLMAEAIQSGLQLAIATTTSPVPPFGSRRLSSSAMATLQKVMGKPAHAMRARSPRRYASAM